MGTQRRVRAMGLLAGVLLVLIVCLSFPTEPLTAQLVPISTMLNTTLAPKPMARLTIKQTPRQKPKPTLNGPILIRDIYESGHERVHPELCPSLGAGIRLLVLITSSPLHSSSRTAIRLTWGHYAARKDVAIAFVLGSPPLTLRPAIEAEDELYGDLIIGRFLDSYSNLTLKTLSMLEWKDTYCPRAQFLLKTDDDMFINVPRLLEFSAARSKVKRTIWGKVMQKSLPHRLTKKKYYVSPVQFPGKVFPDFATGPAYLMTSDCVGKLLTAAPAERFLQLEDVFITGVLASKMNITRKNEPEFYNKKVATNACTIQRGLAIHMVRYHEQFDMWRKLLDGRTKCSG